ncbi:MAG: iron-containing alcohol dehydrogenase, partial [Bacteroidetes bacterium]|nr:iron-containing alcohol dehydrogenase [Bacteroidota bacterium]
KANAILLPAFLRFMREHSRVKEKIRFIDNMFIEDGGIEQFVNDLGISTKLYSYDIKEEDIDEFVKKVIVKSDVKITPAKITEREIGEIYRDAVA